MTAAGDPSARQPASAGTRSATRCGSTRTARTARTDRAGYLRDLIEQVLFTAPGERVNRPDFGAGVGQLVFAPTGPEVAATTQMLVHGALQQWLGDLIDVAGVQVSAVDSTLTVESVTPSGSRSSRAPCSSP